MNARIRKIPRPDVRSRFSSASGSATSDKLETASFVHDVDNHRLRLELDRQHNLFPPVLAVAVIVGVDHTLAHGHSEFVQVVLSEASGFGDAHHNVFSEVHAFQLRVQRDFKTLIWSRH